MGVDKTASNQLGFDLIVINLVLLAIVKFWTLILLISFIQKKEGILTILSGQRLPSHNFWLRRSSKLSKKRLMDSGSLKSSWAKSAAELETCSGFVGWLEPSVVSQNWLEPSNGFSITGSWLELTSVSRFGEVCSLLESCKYICEGSVLAWVRALGS